MYPRDGWEQEGDSSHLQAEGGLWREILAISYPTEAKIPLCSVFKKT